MSSKADVPNKTDFLKYSVSNFIENERFVNEVQKHPPGLGKNELCTFRFRYDEKTNFRFSHLLF